MIRRIGVRSEVRGSVAAATNVSIEPTRYHDDAREEMIAHMAQVGQYGELSGESSCPLLEESSSTCYSY